MPDVDETSRISRFSIDNFEDLSKEIDYLYEKLANGINTKTDTITSDDTAPAVTDTQYEIGTIWVKEDSDQAYILTSISMVASVKEAAWTEIT